MGVSDLSRFGVAERAVWPGGRAGTAASSSWILGAGCLVASSATPGRYSVRSVRSPSRSVPSI
eukprot:11034986-Alexandrium_andersonii.AAC.1